MKKSHTALIITVIITFILIILIIAPNKKSILGIWKIIDTDYDYYYIFNKNKTCSYEMKVARLDCTYEINDSKLTILFKGKEHPDIYEYHFEGKNLIIKDSTGKDRIFSRINGVSRII